MIAKCRSMLAGDEDVLIAKLLFDPDFMAKHAGLIDSGLFMIEPHRTVAQAVISRHEREEPFDTSIIVKDVLASGVDEQLLTDEINQWVAFEPFGEQRALEAIRQLRKAANVMRLDRILDDAKREIQGDAFADPSRIIGEMQERFELLKPASVSKSITLADLMKTDVSEESDPVMPTGLEWFDKAIGGGFAQGDKMFIGGAPGVGKTTLGLQIVSSFLETNPTATAVWCAGEMRLTKLRNRMLMMMSDLTIGVLRRTWDDPMLSEFQAAQKRSAIERMGWLADRLSFLEAPLSIPAIEAEIIATKPALVIIDYLQLIKVRDAANRRDEIDLIVREICRLAQHYGTAFYVISDEGKGGEPDKPRTIHTAFKESSEIEHAGDYCLYGFTPSVKPDEDPPAIVDVKWQSLKARDGERVSIWTRFNRPVQRFEGIEGTG